MTTRDYRRKALLEARQWPIGSADREYRRRGARKLGWICKGVPTCDWIE